VGPLRYCKVCFIPGSEFDRDAPDSGEHRQAAGATTANAIRANSDVRYWGQSGHRLVKASCPVLTQSGHPDRAQQCPLLWGQHSQRSRSSRGAADCGENRHWYVLPINRPTISLVHGLVSSAPHTRIEQSAGLWHRPISTAVCQGPFTCPRQR